MLRLDDCAFLKEKKLPKPEKNEQGGRPRPLYDIPYMFEAREFLRKKLIGKKVTRWSRVLAFSATHR